MERILRTLRLAFVALLLINAAACTTDVPANKLIADELANPTWDAPAN